MNGRTHVFGISVLVVLAVGSARVCAVLPASEADALAARLMAAVHVIEQEHYDPPPRQELVRQLMQALARRFQMTQPIGLGRELSFITDEAELEARLRLFCSGLSDLRTPESEFEHPSVLEQVALQDVLSSLFGSNVVRTRKDQVVDEQFANNRYVGTGITLSLANDTKLPQLQTVFENGPAQRAGAQNGDLILKIDGESTEGMLMEDVIDKLRGPAGSDVTVRLRQPNKDEERALTITRGVVPLKRTTLERREGSVVIRTNTLTAATVQDLRELEEQLGETDSEVVLDLQSVDGFNLHHAVLLADALLDGGDIGRVRTTRGVREFSASTDCVFHGRRLKIQVTGRTAGAAEWVVAALQDNGRATVVGQQTAGLPVITEAFEVPGTDWVLQLTCGVLERADGRPILRTDLLTAHLAPAKNRQIMRSGRATSADGRLVDPPAHDGGVVPDEVLDPSSQPFDPPPVQPLSIDWKMIRDRFFGGRSEPK
ncbi:MAG: S41 family peptidase [Planctomycetaceae bacterium]